MYVIEDIKNALVNAGIKNKMKYNPHRLIIKLNDDNICYIKYEINDSDVIYCNRFYIKYEIKTKSNAGALDTYVIQVNEWDKVGIYHDNYINLKNDVNDNCDESIIDSISDLSDIMPNTINELVEMINFYSE